MSIWGNTALHHTVRRDNSLKIINLLLDHGANPALVNRDHISAATMAARRGRGHVLELLEQRNIPTDLHAVDLLIAECAKNSSSGAHAIVRREPHLLKELLAQGGTLLAQFAGNGNTDGVRQLLDLGVDVAAPNKEGDLNFEVAKDGTALHSAAWRAWPSTVKLLIERGAPINAQDVRGRTALALAVRACVDSYWKDRRSPESVEALLLAGATVGGVDYPSGYAEVDSLLAAFSVRARSLPQAHRFLKRSICRSVKVWPGFALCPISRAQTASDLRPTKR
jgi:ankyrin repeat protein